MKLWIYTIDAPAIANAMLDLGVDGIISNNPLLIGRITIIRAASC